jgi:AcrR family transcriptional regulator
LGPAVLTAGRSMARKGSETRERIVDAALATLRDEGFAGTTARAIARHGGFNQALIFYHFGSVPRLLLEAFRSMSNEQVARYRAAAAEVSSLSDLVGIARRLHDEDLRSGAITAVTQLMAAASGPEEGRAILDRFEEWIGLVQDALGRAVGGPLAAVVPAREAAYAIATMFLGIELLTRLDPERSEAGAVFDMMASMAQLIEQIAPSMSLEGPVTDSPAKP